MYNISGVVCTLGIEGVLPISSMIVIVGEVIKMEQTLHLGLLHVWVPVSGGGKEVFVRTNLT